MRLAPLALGLSQWSWRGFSEEHELLGLAPLGTVVDTGGKAVSCTPGRLFQSVPDPMAVVVCKVIGWVWKVSGAFHPS